MNECEGKQVVESRFVRHIAEAIGGILKEADPGL